LLDSGTLNPTPKTEEEKASSRSDAGGAVENGYQSEFVPYLLD